MEKEGATFSCEVSHDEVPAQWFREGSKVRPSDNVRIRQEGMTTTAMGCGRASPPPPGLSPIAEWSAIPRKDIHAHLPKGPGGRRRRNPICS